ncbi:MAG: hypothetical protein JWP01_3789 [Myxococcales bacterium]|nr:hypothetical protein [Myxococcales bacterium]
MVTGRGALARIGGGALILGSLGFVAAFSYLAVTFGYPDVLDASASSVLPALAAGGSSMRIASARTARRC